MSKIIRGIGAVFFLKAGNRLSFRTEDIFKLKFVKQLRPDIIEHGLVSVIDFQFQ